MASNKYTGAGNVSDSDFRFVKYVGKTKAGQPVTIALKNAFCISNPDWSFAEKDDTIAAIEFEGCYDDADLESGNKKEPWTIETADGQQAGVDEILLGVGKFYVGNSESDAVAVGLTRGGGKFIVERTYREINADGDPGKVKGRVEKQKAARSFP